MLLMDATHSDQAPATCDPASERGLLAQSIAGDAAALQILIDLHRPTIARLARRLLAWPDEVDDVVQDVFVTLIEKAGRFRGQSSLRTWLITITLNRCCTLCRRWQLRLRMLRDVARRPRDLCPPSESLDRGEDQQRIRRALAKLGARDREVLVLHYLEELPLHHVAELLSIRRNAVEVRLYRARQRLARLLKDTSR